MSQHTIKICAQCGARFAKDPRNTWAYWQKAKYCSRECAGTALSANKSATRPGKFSNYFTKSDGCWEWTGSKDKQGYGQFSFAGKQWKAARFALLLDGRPVPDGMLACHTCDNPRCVRPDHLYVGTSADNAADMVTRKRQNPGSKAKIGPNEVRGIRAASGTQDDIAAQFGISRTNVSLIRNRKTWANIT